MSLVATGLGWAAWDKHRRERWRSEWCESAVARLRGMSPTHEDVAPELERLQGNRAAGRWAEDHVMLMKNGELLFCRFRHGYNSGWIEHLFVARGLNGGWWYSTYHFCNGMAGVAGEEAPESVTDFARRFFARPFDGDSRQCLEPTWDRRSQPAESGRR